MPILAFCQKWACLDGHLHGPFRNFRYPVHDENIKTWQIKPAAPSMVAYPSILCKDPPSRTNNKTIGQIQGQSQGSHFLYPTLFILLVPTLFYAVFYLQSYHRFLITPYNISQRLFQKIYKTIVPDKFPCNKIQPLPTPCTTLNYIVLCSFLDEKQPKVPYKHTSHQKRVFLKMLQIIDQILYPVMGYNPFLHCILFIIRKYM